MQFLDFLARREKNLRRRTSCFGTSKATTSKLQSRAESKWLSINPNKRTQFTQTILSHDRTTVLQTLTKQWSTEASSPREIPDFTTMTSLLNVTSRWTVRIIFSLHKDGTLVRSTAMKGARQTDAACKITRLSFRGREGSRRRLSDRTLTSPFPTNSLASCSRTWRAQRTRNPRVHRWVIGRAVLPDRKERAWRHHFRRLTRCRELLRPARDGCGAIISTVLVIPSFCTVSGTFYTAVCVIAIVIEKIANH